MLSRSRQGLLKSSASCRRAEVVRKNLVKMLAEAQAVAARREQERAEAHQMVREALRTALMDGEAAPLPDDARAIRETLKGNLDALKADECSLLFRYLPPDEFFERLQHRWTRERLVEFRAWFFGRARE